MSDVTIIIPTINRSDLLSLQVHWYEKNNFLGNIIIADSSNKENFGLNKIMLDRSRLNINHIDCIQLSEKDSTQKALSFVKTEFVCWSGDDDFHLVEGLEKSKSFLKQNSFYGGARGQGIRILLDDIISNKKHFIFETYDAPFASGENFSERIVSYLSNGGGDTHYCLHRSEILKNSYKNVRNIENHLLGSTDLPIIMTLAKTNIAFLTHLSLFKGIHHRRYLDHKSKINNFIDVKYMKDLNTLRYLALRESTSNDESKFIDELISYLLGIEKKYFIKGIKFLIRKKIKDIIFTIKFNNQIRKFTRLIKFNYKKTKDL